MKMNNLPNILLIVADQLRYDCIGFSGDYPVRTPHIDQLATEGVWFTNAYTHIPLCSPARQSLINGRRPEAFGSLWNYNIGPRVSALDPSEYAWPRELQRLGLKSGYVGKWNVHPSHSPLSFGYSDYVGDDQYEQFKINKYPDVKYTQSYLGEANPIPLEDSKTHWLAGKAISLMNEYGSERSPWHIRLDFTDPHLPCRPSAPFAQMYDPALIPMWRNFNDDFHNKPYIQKQQLHSWGVQHFTWDDWAPIAARYYGMISQLDDAVGRVMKALREVRQENNTLVIFTADHGDMCGAHRMMDKHYILYDDVVRVPLAICWPEAISKGRVCDQFVYNLLDLPPTMLELLNVHTDAEFHGRSWMPLLTGEPPADWRNEVVSTYNGQQFGLYTQRMIRTREWKYVWNTTDVDELYELQQDPDELNNVIYDAGNRDIINQLRKRLYDVLIQDGDRLVDNEWMRNQLLHGHII
jgi:arylsulfatase A-like enzyme